MQVTLLMIAFFAAITTLTNLFGSVSVDTHGARVVSYVPKGEDEVFFVSETGTGGMPICWPWFAGNGPREDSARHGIARYFDFEVAGIACHSPGDTEIVLRLESSEATRRLFPHDFALAVSVRLADGLAVTMTGENTGKTPFAVTEAFHPYFAVVDSARSRVEGRERAECRLCDADGGKTLSIACSGGAFRVWRPNPESHLSKAVSSIGPDDWKRFVCVEFGTYSRESAYVLRPGERHVLSGTLRRPTLRRAKHIGPDVGLCSVDGTFQSAVLHFPFCIPDLLTFCSQCSHSGCREDVL